MFLAYLERENWVPHLSVETMEKRRSFSHIKTSLYEVNMQINSFGHRSDLGKKKIKIGEKFNLNQGN